MAGIRNIRVTNRSPVEVIETKSRNCTPTRSSRSVCFPRCPSLGGRFQAEDPADRAATSWVGEAWASRGTVPAGPLLSSGTTPAGLLQAAGATPALEPTSEPETALSLTIDKPGRAGSNPVVGFLPNPPRLPHLQLDDGPEVSPRRVPDHHQLALDDGGLHHVKPLVRLAHGERHDTQHVTSAGRFLIRDGRTHIRPTSSLSAPTTPRLLPGSGGVLRSSAGSSPSTRRPCHTTCALRPFDPVSTCPWLGRTSRCCRRLC